MTNWPHAPVHRFTEPGAYMVTCGIYNKVHLLNDSERLTLVHDTLLTLAIEFGWQLQAWSVLINHYHFVGLSPEDPTTLRDFIGELHEQTAGHLNMLDHTPGRKVWFQYWDSRITFERSYLARLRYVHEIQCIIELSVMRQTIRGVPPHGLSAPRRKAFSEQWPVSRSIG